MNKFIVLMLIFSSPVNAGIYKWTDSKGNVHFGDKPVENKSAEELIININNKAGISSSPGRKADREYLLKKIDEENLAEAERIKKKNALKKKRRKLCDTYKLKYQNQIRSNNLYTMSPDGERTYLSQEERAARKIKLTKGISKYCD